MVKVRSCAKSTDERQNREVFIPLIFKNIALFASDVATGCGLHRRSQKLTVLCLKINCWRSPSLATSLFETPKIRRQNTRLKTLGSWTILHALGLWGYRKSADSVACTMPTYSATSCVQLLRVSPRRRILRIGYGKVHPMIHRRNLGQVIGHACLLF